MSAKVCIIKQHTKNSIVFSADKGTIIRRKRRRKREKFLTSHCQFFIVFYLKRPILPYSLSFSVEKKNENRKKKILSIFCCRRREQVLNFIHSFFSFCRQTILLILIWIAGQVTKKLRKLSTIWRKPSRWEKRMLWCGADIGLVKEENMPCSFCFFPFFQKRRKCASVHYYHRHHHHHLCQQGKNPKKS